MNYFAHSCSHKFPISQFLNHNGSAHCPLLTTAPELSGEVLENVEKPPDRHILFVDINYYI